MIGSISILYNDVDPKTYRGVRVYVRLKDGKERRRIFRVKNPAFDYICGIVWLKLQGAETIMGSSSVDHFIMDGGEINEGPKEPLIRQAILYLTMDKLTANIKP